jgi:hypothetical protein
MMSELTRLYDEALRLLTVYDEHKNSTDEHMRLKAHVDLDRFLMEHREVAAILVVSGLKAEIEALAKSEQATRKKTPWFKRFKKGGFVNVNDNNNISSSVHHEG